MRFSELHLVRYGQFEDCRLHFPGTDRDLQVIYGPNEAGKSTTMAAVSDLLFGFPSSTRFDFRFDKTLLRVGAVIDGPNGSFSCRRRKGNKGTLIDENDQPIDESMLLALLGGQKDESFQRMFSLDHRRLREGGQAILNAKDDAGEAIFAAGSGLIGVVELAKQLEKEASEIWSDRAAASRKYYAALRDYDTAKARLREHQLKSGQWAERKKVLDVAEAALDRKRIERDALQKRSIAVERVRRIITPIAARRHLVGELADLGELPTLAPDALKVVDDALRIISEAETEERLAGERLKSARNEKAGLVFNTRILRQRTAITALQARKGAVDKALGDTPALKSKAEAGTADISRLVEELGWESMSAVEVKQRLPGRGEVVILRQLIEEKSALDAALKAASDEAEAQQQSINDVTRLLAELPPSMDLPPLEAALRVIHSKGDVEALRKAAILRRDRSGDALRVALASLTPWTGTADDLISLVLPSEAEIARLVADLDHARDNIAQERSAVRAKSDEKALKDLEREQLLGDQHAVPASLLLGIREQRNRTWSQLDAHLRGQQPVAEPSEMADRFQGEVQQADEVADRRFDSAETSAALAGLERDIARLALQIAQGHERVKEAMAVAENAQKTWAAAMTPIGSIGPSDFISWRTRRDRVVGLIESLKSETESVAAVDTIDGEIRTLLSTLALPIDVRQASNPLSMLIATAEQVAADAKNQANRHAELKTRKLTIEGAALRANATMIQVGQSQQEWADRWRAALTTSGLNMDATITIVRSQLESIDSLNKLAGEVVGYERRMRDIGHDIEGFENAVKDTARVCDVAITEEHPNGILAELQSQLETAIKLSERAASLDEQSVQAERQMGDARKKIETAAASLKPLLASSGVDDHDALRTVIGKVDEARIKRARVASLTEEIITAGDGRSLEQLEEESADKDTADLSAESGALQEQLTQLSREIEQLAEQKRAAELAFHQGDESQEAAIAAADQALARSEMDVQAEAYLRKRAEKELLQWTINQYRQEKQAPLLKRATEIFSTLTLGKYVSLSVDIDGEKPILYAVEAGGAFTVPASRLSEGTIDQLYLALRLAAVEESVEAGLKLPFLADDLFINYDNERAAAGFRVLAELAEKTQVLFFTHNDNLVELAKRAVHPVIVSSCRLAPQSEAA